MSQVDGRPHKFMTRMRNPGDVSGRYRWRVNTVSGKVVPAYAGQRDVTGWEREKVKSRPSSFSRIYKVDVSSRITV